VVVRETRMIYGRRSHNGRCAVIPPPQSTTPPTTGDADGVRRRSAVISRSVGSVLSSGHTTLFLSNVLRLFPASTPSKIGMTAAPDHADLRRITLQSVSAMLLSNTSGISPLMTYLAFYWTIRILSPPTPAPPTPPTPPTPPVVEGPPQPKA